MKRIYLLMVTVSLVLSLLVACSNNSSTNVDEDGNTGTDVTNENETQQNLEEEKEDDEVTVEEQLDLKIGDTGTIQTSIGTYELTIESAEIVTELDGLESMLEELIILDMTFKNIGDKAIVAEDILAMIGITGNFDGSNNHNSAEAYPSIDNFTGEFGPGEEIKTQFIADIYVADEYYFRPDRGVVSAGTSSDVMWTITAEEAGK